MSLKNLQLAVQFFDFISQSESETTALDWLAQDATYELSFAPPVQVACTFHGRRDIKVYWLHVKATYQILFAGDRTFTLAGDRVIARGSELAFLKSRGQLVQAEWHSVIEFSGGLIKKVTMSIDRWLPFPIDCDRIVSISRSSAPAQA